MTQNLHELEKNALVEDLTSSAALGSTSAHCQSKNEWNDVHPIPIKI